MNFWHKNALKRYNDSFHAEIPQVSRETRETLEKRLKDYQGYEKILINQVEFFDDWSGMATPQNQVEWIALRLQKSNLFHHLPFDILERATVQLIYYVQHVLYHSWSRGEGALRSNSKAEHQDPEQDHRVDLPVALHAADFGCRGSQPLRREHFVHYFLYLIRFNLTGKQNQC